MLLDGKKQTVFNEGIAERIINPSTKTVEGLVVKFILTSTIKFMKRDGDVPPYIGKKI
jgi:hypothetical protein